MISHLRKSFLFKAFTMLMLLIFLNSIAFPTISYALTGGPGQPEVHSFAPIGTTDMVDLSTGDFNYNLPLLEIGGYPINMTYNSGITMDQEASWVGLGWNINPGVINRSMRGLPDDAHGDIIENEFNLKKMESAGISLGLDLEVFGLEFGKGSAGISLSASFGIQYNTYTGYNFTSSLGLSPDIAYSSGDAFSNDLHNMGLKGNLTVSQGGRFNGNVNFSNRIKEKVNDKHNTSKSSSIGLSFDNDGFSGFNMGVSGNIVSGVDPENSTSGTNRNYGASLGYSFADRTYTPSVDFARLTTAMSASIKVGGSIFGQDISGTLSAFLNKNSLKHKQEKAFAYGYMYSSGDHSNSLMDFNREDDGSYHKHTTNLPLTNLTYDMYSVQGQGVSGTFRPFRGNVGSVFDKEVSSDGLDGSIGGEIGVGQIFSFGIDGALSYVKSGQKPWTKNNGAINNLKYSGISYPSGSEGVSIDYEPFYFKQIGELSVDEEMENTSSSMYGKVGGKYPTRVDIGSNHNAYSKYVKENNGTKESIAISGPIKRSKRAKRNQLMTYLTKTEASLLGKPVNDAARDQHLAELSIVKDDGSRYKYGIAAYNKVQYEYNFNVNEDEPTNFCGFTKYENEDISTSNKKGRDHFFMKKKVPAYAHAYLLTEILSSDYIDVDDNGPSDDDFGNWTKFEYEKAEDNYKWRSPYTPNGKENVARHNRGLLSVNDDSKANIVYGEKELYYLSKISSKTQVAVFYTSQRNDAYEAGGVEGGRGEGKMLRLDKIELFNKIDYNLDPNNATPIKTVHFKYNYSLCKGIYNHLNYSSSNPGQAETGKLTLEKVYFSYGTSEKSLLSPYEFTYASGTNNPNYDPNAYDMWGNFKEVDNNDCVAISEYPYVKQDDNANDLEKRAKAWTLESIKLPSGGKIKVEFESDDYAYVQNRQAKQFYQVLGFGTNSESTNTTDSNNPTSTLYGDESNNYELKRYLHLKVPTGLSLAEENRIIGSIANEWIFFRFKMMLAPGQWEYISSYFKMIPGSADFYQNGKLSIKVEHMNTGEGISSGVDVSPFSKAAWQFTKMHRPRLAKGDMEEVNDEIDFDEFIDGIEDIVGNLVDFYEGMNTRLMKAGIGRHIQVDKSWVRLFNPYGKKYGGNSRVKEISMIDNWSFMNNASANSIDASYTQSYDYTTNNGISSGVADWEPVVSKENPFVEPTVGADIQKFTGMESSYTERPIGASFFPSPKVVYSKVTVTDKAYNTLTDTEVTNNLSKTGYVENDFYTSKDFPTRVRQTELKAKPQKANPIFSLFQINRNDYMTVSQGYSIELNDMSGKPKSVKVFAENSLAPISAVYYNYDPNSEENLPSNLKLNDETNSVYVIDPEGNVKKSSIGVEMETVNDFREHYTKTHTVSTDGNLAGFLAFVFPAVIPTVFPSYSSQASFYRAAVTTKVIFRRGLLSKVTKIEDNSSFSTKNLAYDSETGQVLLTATKNEFGDDIYNFSYPAHWMYDEMGQGYKNTRLTGKLNLASGKINSGGEDLIPGDEIIVNNGTSLQYAWVADDDDDSLYIIDVSGAAVNVSGDKYFIVIKSGRDNQQSLMAGSITSMLNPIDDDGQGNIIFDFKSGSDYAASKILDANAMAYSDKWRTKLKKPLAQGMPSPNDWGVYQNLIEEMGYNNPHSTNETFITNSYKAFLNALIQTHANSPILLHEYNSDNPDYNSSLLYPQLSIENGQVVTDYNTSLSDVSDLLFYNVDSEDIVSKPCETTPDFSFRRSDPLENSPSHSTQIDVDGNAEYMWPLQFGDMNAGPNDCNCISLHSENFVYNLLVENNYSQNNWEVTDVSIQNLQSYTNLNLTNSSMVFTFLVTISNGSETVTEEIQASCWPYTNSINLDNCPGEEKVNPYTVALRGQFRPETQYVYKTEREYLYESGSPDLQKSGTYKKLEPFWTYDSQNSDWVQNLNNWQYTSTISEYSPFGNEVENKDALGRYSSALFGYANTLPKAVSQNARYNEIYSENFEDYKYPIDEDCFYEPHFLFAKNSNVSIDEENAHSGKYSLKLIDGASTSASNDYIKTKGAQVEHTNAYTLSDADYLGGFSPSPWSGEATKSFVLSYWVKEENSGDHTISLSTFDGSAFSSNLLGNVKEGIVIDDWKRIEYSFNLSYNSSIETLRLNISNPNGNSSEIYIDDIRIHPFNSSLKAFVYHPISHQYVAELDENNYATFYEYDNAGRLLRIKKETERGIMTIQESFNHIQNNEGTTGSQPQ